MSKTVLRSKVFMSGVIHFFVVITLLRRRASNVYPSL